MAAGCDKRIIAYGKEGEIIQYITHVSLCRGPFWISSLVKVLCTFAKFDHDLDIYVNTCLHVVCRQLNNGLLCRAALSKSKEAILRVKIVTETD